MLKLDFKKKFSELSRAEQSAFYDNVRKTVFRYVQSRASDDELAYEVINDAYMKALTKADKDVTIRSLRSYIGTIAWNMLYHKKIKKNPYTFMEPGIMQMVESIEDRDDEPRGRISDELRTAIKKLTPLEKRRLRDLAHIADYKKLESVWGMTNAGVRQVVFKIRRKIKANL